MASVGRFQDKIVIVTGGCNGIGRGIVKVFREHGGKVVIWDIDDETGKTMTSAEQFSIHCDMTKEDDIKSAVEQTLTKYGSIHCLINNAGWHPPFHTIDDYSADEMRKLMDLNFIAYFLAAKYTLPHLRKTKGAIVNIASTASTHGQRQATAYCASKAAISGFTRALALEEALNKVRVNAVIPGATNTPLLHTFVTNADDLKEYEDMSAFRRLGEPEEIGHVCLFLATDATFVIGQEIQCTGGMCLGTPFQYRS
ncbi:17-beta-hydroxysteroid dehydrogenase 14-like [Mya arenaria]|uniref:17-beta-hydroxysteroid dehydrogenase 14-like n=1 Tax=Mya arenaria TaxID=6604 RepID=UPI0022E335CC|nr:17-beta-hydroxysteroid dehydrogenase 14-like [Mya arenaria]